MIIALEYNDFKAIIESKGAELKSLKKGEKEYMWSGDPKFWGKTSPVLFPMIGTLKDEKTIINSEVYSISKHGFARDLEFFVERLNDNTAVFTLTNNEYTEKMYPYAFCFKIKYVLSEYGIRIEYYVDNESDYDMPFCIGGHPAFSCPFEEGESFEDYSLVFSENETAFVPLYNLNTGLHEESTRTLIIENSNKLRLNHSLFYKDVLYFDKIKSRLVSLVSSKSSTCLTVKFDSFDTLGIWQPKDAPFICIEPWCGSADFDDCSGVFSEKRGIQTAKPNETKQYLIEIVI